MILVLGGTSDSLEICDRLNKNKDLLYILSVTTSYGEDLAKKHAKNVITGKLSEEDMIDFIEKNNINKIIDATHPYAIKVSKNTIKCAKEKNIDYLRYERKSLIEEISYKNKYVVGSVEEACELAREKGIDLAAISPVDPMGRVRAQDVAAHSTAPAPKAPVAATPAAEAKDDGRIVREKMTRRRQTIAKRLLEVRQSTAMLTTFNEIDMTNVMALRSRKKDEFFEKNGVRLGFMSFFTKAVVAALKKYPYVNSEMDGDEVLLKNFFDIGIAVSTDGGLVVPNVVDADRKNFAEIEAAIGELAGKARDNKLTIADMTGGSFTITNGGVFGSLLSTPILNGTQVGILGMHTIQKRPVAIGDNVEIRPMMYVALSYDHRVIDGKDSVGFLKMVKELLENPEDLLLGS